VAAYLRSLDSPWSESLIDPANLKKFIMLLHRPITVSDVPTSGTGPRILWNGQVADNSCVADYELACVWEVGDICPDIREDLDGMSGEPCGANDFPGSSRRHRKRQNDDGTCSLPPGSGATCPLNPGNNGPGGPGKSIRWSRGLDGPRCESGTCGGTLCRGYYCSPRPAGTPPDFHDPKDPARGGSGQPPGPPPSTTTDIPKPPPTTPTLGPTSVPSPPSSPFDWGVRYYDEVSELT